jgi:hypothetical protein
VCFLSLSDGHTSHTGTATANDAANAYATRKADPLNSCHLSMPYYGRAGLQVYSLGITETLWQAV